MTPKTKSRHGAVPTFTAFLYLAACHWAIADTHAAGGEIENLDTTIFMSDENTYETYGLGADEPEANFNAMRNGLQFATEQLVISEIKIEAEEIVEDALYSTMNGYIESFDVLESAPIGDQHFIRARLKISPVQIKNTVERFSGIGLGIENTAAIQSDGIAAALRAAQAEFDRRKNQLFVASKLYKDMLKDLPDKAYDFTLDNIEFGSEVPATVTVAGTISYNPQWVKDYQSYYVLIQRLISWLPEEVYIQGSRRWSYSMRKSCYRDESVHYCNKSPVFTLHDGDPDELRFLRSAQFTIDSKSRHFVAEDKAQSNRALEKQYFSGEVPHGLFDGESVFSDKRFPTSLCTYDNKGQLIKRISRLPVGGEVANPSSKDGEWQPRRLEVVNGTDVYTFKLPLDSVANVEERIAPTYWLFIPGSRGVCGKTLQSENERYLFKPA